MFEPSGDKHLQVSRGTCKANWKVPEKRTKSRCMQNKNVSPGEGADSRAGWCKELQWTEEGHSHWLWPLCSLSAILKWAEGRKPSGTVWGRERTLESSIRMCLNTNIISVHYSSSQFLETREELLALSWHIYNGLILNPNRLNPNQMQILSWTSPYSIFLIWKIKITVRLAIQWQRYAIVHHARKFPLWCITTYYLLKVPTHPQRTTMCPLMPAQAHLQEHSNASQSVSCRTLLPQQEPNGSTASGNRVYEMLHYTMCRHPLT